MSSKSTDSIKALNEFRYLDMSSCLLADQFPCWLMCCFRTSHCVSLCAVEQEVIHGLVALTADTHRVVT